MTFFFKFNCAALLYPFLLYLIRKVSQNGKKKAYCSSLYPREKPISLSTRVLIPSPPLVMSLRLAFKMYLWYNAFAGSFRPLLPGRYPPTPPSPPLGLTNNAA